MASRIELCASRFRIDPALYADNIDTRVNQDIEDAITSLFQRQLQAERTNDWYTRLKQIADDDFKGDLSRAQMGMLVQSEKRRGTPSLESKVNYERDRVLGEFINSMDQTALKYRDRLTGHAELPESVELNIYKELDGLSTGDALAAELAGNFKRLAEELKWSANSHGAAIRTLSDWLMPQRHRKDKLLGLEHKGIVERFKTRGEPRTIADVKAIEGAMDASANKWTNYVRPLLDRDKMRRRLNDAEMDAHLRTLRPDATDAAMRRMKAEVFGRSRARNPILSPEELAEAQSAYRVGVPMIDSELNTMLNKAFHTIINDGDGVVDLEVPGQHGAKLASVGSDHRVLHFKDAESAHAYSKRYGESNTLMNMVNHLKSMAEATVLLREAGPDPQRLQKTMSGVIQDWEKDLGGKGGRHRVEHLEDVWNIIGGSLPEQKRWANRLANTRNWLNMSALGSSVMAAIPDPVYGAFNTFMNGGSVTRYGVNRMAQLMPVIARMTREQARSESLVVESAAANMRAFIRFGEVEGTESMQKWSNAFYNVNMLAPFQKGSEAAFRQTMMQNIQSMAKKVDTSRGVSKRQRAFMDRYGITSNDLRNLPRDEDGTITLHNAPEDIRLKIGGAIREESVYGSMEQGARTRALVTMGEPGGSYKGEAGRFTWMWKSFIHSLMVSNGARMLEAIRGNTGAGGKSAGLLYATSLMATASVLGAMSLQLREVGKGRTPRSMETEEDITKLLVEGGVQAGFGGIFADYIYSAGVRDRYGKGIGSQLVPPAVSIAVDGLFSQLLFWTVNSDEDLRTNYDLWVDRGYPDRMSVTAATRLVPFSSLPVIRAAYDRVVLSNILSSDARAQMLEREERYMDEHRMDYWWRPE